MPNRIFSNEMHSGIGRDYRTNSDKPGRYWLNNATGKHDIFQDVPPEDWIEAYTSPVGYIAYLAHRGRGKSHKRAAELI